MVKMAQHIILRIFPLLFMHSIISTQAAEESNEELYRRTVQSWSSNGSWEPWNEYTAELFARWQAQSSGDNPRRNRLPIVGGLEEGILAIEKATVARGEGTNAPRDRTLSRLYGAYGRTLLDLTADECRDLALDPHTLLIGIEAVSRNDEPSTFLCRENAENALRNSAALDATNTLAEELLETITGSSSTVHERKPKEFVAELFDSFADTFDQKLVEGLGYVVPRFVGDAAKSLRPIYGSVLDAGCGTGLAGRHLKPLVESVMIGVDASQKMLDIAAECTTQKGCGLGAIENEAAAISDVSGKGDDEDTPLYDDLLVLDLEEMTLENTLNKKGNTVSGSDIQRQGFDLIVAADVLVYFGSLSDLLQTFASLSADGAGLIFSCERASEEEAPLGWRLLPSGRFSHTKEHALEAAEKVGYGLAAYQEIVPRMERGEEVQGHLFTFVLNRMGKHNNEL